MPLSKNFTESLECSIDRTFLGARSPGNRGRDIFRHLYAVVARWRSPLITLDEHKRGEPDAGGNSYREQVERAVHYTDLMSRVECLSFNPIMRLALTGIDFHPYRSNLQV